MGKKDSAKAAGKAPSKGAAKSKSVLRLIKKARLTAEQLAFWHAAGGSEWTRRLLAEGMRMKEMAKAAQAPIEKTSK